MKLETYPRYLLADDFDARSEKLSMRRSAWTIASSLPKLQLETSFRAFAESLSLPENEASSAILELLAHRLIYESCNSQEESLKEARPVHELLKGSFSTLAIGILGNENHADQDSQAASSPAAFHTRLGEFPKMTPIKNTIVGWISNANELPAAAPVLVTGSKTDEVTNLNPTAPSSANRLPALRNRSTVKSEKKKFKLQPIISQIEKLSKGGMEGSVLAYQVFLKVPAKLLREEGIESLNLVDAHTEFSSEKLCQAIIRATTEITGYNLKIEGYNNP